MESMVSKGSSGHKSEADLGSLRVVLLMLTMHTA